METRGPTPAKPRSGENALAQCRAIVGAADRFLCSATHKFCPSRRTKRGRRPDAHPRHRRALLFTLRSGCSSVWALAHRAKRYRRVSSAMTLRRLTTPCPALAARPLRPPRRSAGCRARARSPDQRRICRCRTSATRTHCSRSTTARTRVCNRQIVICARAGATPRSARRRPRTSTGDGAASVLRQRSVLVGVVVFATEQNQAAASTNLRWKRRCALQPGAHAST